MRRLAPVVLLLALAACATSGAPEVTVGLEQLTSFSDLRFAGPINVEYRVTATNPTDAPVTLTRIDIKTVGPGAYVLRTPTQPVNLTVPAKSSASVTITARGSAAGGNANSAEPVTVRATAYFDTPAGPLTRVVNQNFGRE